MQLGVHARGASRAAPTVLAEGHQAYGAGVLPPQREGNLPAHALVQQNIALGARGGQQGTAIGVPGRLVAGGGAQVDLTRGEKAGQQGRCLWKASKAGQEAGAAGVEMRRRRCG